MGDSSAGRILWVEVLDSTGTLNSENVDSALFERGDSNETGDGRTASGDGNFEMGDSNFEMGDSNFEMGDSNFIETIALLVSVL